MSLSTDSSYWWKTISGLNPGLKYTYQYLVDGVIKIADPLSPLILDPNNDANIEVLIIQILFPTHRITPTAL